MYYQQNEKIIPKKFKKKSIGETLNIYKIQKNHNPTKNREKFGINSIKIIDFFSIFNNSMTSIFSRFFLEFISDYLGRFFLDFLGRIITDKKSRFGSIGSLYGLVRVPVALYMILTQTVRRTQIRIEEQQKQSGPYLSAEWTAVYCTLGDCMPDHNYMNPSIFL